MATFGLQTSITKRYRVINMAGAVALPATPYATIYPTITVPMGTIVHAVYSYPYVRATLPAGGGFPQRIYWFRPPDLLEIPMSTPPFGPAAPLRHHDTGVGAVVAQEDDVATNVASAGAMPGLAYGVFYAFKNQKGVLGYIGYALLFNFFGWAAGAGVGYTIKAIKK